MPALACQFFKLYISKVVKEETLMMKYFSLVPTVHQFSTMPYNGNHLLYALFKNLQLFQYRGMVKNNNNTVNAASE